MSGLRARRGREGRWNGAGARTGLTLEVTHCGPARVWPRERPHTTVGPTCYAFISADLQPGATSMGQLGRTQKSQTASEKKLKAYACELEQTLEARTGELAEAREHQTATSEMLRVISNLPGKLEPVFQSMLENATRLCEAKFGTLYLREGQAFRLVGQHNAPAAYVEERRRNPLLLRRIAGSALGRVAATK